MARENLSTQQLGSFGRPFSRTQAATIVLLAAVAFNASCQRQPLDAESAALQRQAKTLEVSSLKKVTETIIAGLGSVEIITGLVNDVRIKLPSGGEILLEKNCKLNIVVSVEGMFTIRTWGASCKGFQLPKAIPLPAQIHEISWNIRTASFAYRTTPQWTNALNGVVTPLINQWIKAHLPPTIKSLKTQFSLGNPEQTLQVLSPLLGHPPEKGIQAAVSNMRDVTLRFSSWLQNDTKIRLNRAELMISKNEPIEIQLSFSGNYEKRSLSRIYFAAPGGVQGSSAQLKKKLGTILGSFAVARVLLVTIDRLGFEPQKADYEVLAGTLVSAPEVWKFRSENGKFHPQGGDKRAGTINGLMASEAPLLLEAFRALLKQAQPTFPILLPAGLFRDL